MQFRGFAAASLAVALLPTHRSFSQRPFASEAAAQLPGQAAEHAPQHESGPSAVGAARDRSGPCVLLKNDNVLFGHAHQLGEFVIVRTGQGSEVQLPRKEVACWAGSLRDLYRYRIDHRRPGEVAAHLRDARWCLRYDLYDLAKSEIETVKRLSPSNAEVTLIEDQLLRMTAPRANVQSTARDDAVPSSVKPVQYQAEAESASVDLATLRGFASHVQPMLLNRCGVCHGKDHSGDADSLWRLVVPPGGARASSQMTRHNLLESLRFVNASAPLQSELLIKATTAHGDSEAPLSARNAKAIQSFQHWLTVAGSAIAGDRMPRATDSGMSAVPANPTPSLMEVAVAATSSPTELGGSWDDAIESTEQDDQPARLPEVANPFDPDLFNRKFHLDSSNAK